jgi:hypothetical protein
LHEIDAANERIFEPRHGHDHLLSVMDVSTDPSATVCVPVLKKRLDLFSQFDHLFIDLQYSSEVNIPEITSQSNSSTSTTIGIGIRSCHLQT